MFANVFSCNMGHPEVVAPHPRSIGAKVYLAGVALCALPVIPVAHAQTPSTPAGTSTVSEQARKQAESPYKWILINANVPRPAARAPSADRPAAAPAPTAARIEVRAEPAARSPVQPRSASTETAPTADSRNADTLAAARAAQNAAVPTSAQVALNTPATARPAEPSPQPSATQAAPASAQPTPIANPAPAVEVLAPNNPVPPEPVINLVPMRQDEPRIPPAVMRDTPKATVRAAFTINTDGSVSDVKIVNSSSRQFNNPVMAAVRNWRFQPIELAQQTEVEMAFNFE